MKPLPLSVFEVELLDLQKRSRSRSIDSTSSLTVSRFQSPARRLKKLRRSSKVVVGAVLLPTFKATGNKTLESVTETSAGGGDGDRVERKQAELMTRKCCSDILDEEATFCLFLMFTRGERAACSRPSPPLRRWAAAAGGSLSAGRSQSSGRTTRSSGPGTAGRGCCPTAWGPDPRWRPGA